jgi:predicted pyridoxine 5'-phosphate oxidase superfamily flavin-nucleotide-binding protein
MDKEFAAPASDVAFTPSVKAVQERRGSREDFRWDEENGAWRTTVTPELASFVANRDGAYLATANAQGHPYIQHRGGPKGFIRVLDEKTLAFADFHGNRQFITTGNLLENDRAFLFLMDYATRRRIKLWGRARVVEDDHELIRSLMPEGYRARPLQAIVFSLICWDINCNQHIVQRFATADFMPTIEQLKARVAELEAENARLRGDAP